MYTYEMPSSTKTGLSSFASVSWIFAANLRGHRAAGQSSADTVKEGGEEGRALRVACRAREATHFSAAARLTSPR